MDGGVIPVTLHAETLAPVVTLLCLHGWTLDHSSFSAQQSLGRQGMAMATFDRRGFGANTLPPNFSQEVDDLSRITRALPGRVILYGVSQGARLALRAAALGAVAPDGLILQGGHLDGFVCEEPLGEAIPFDYYRACFGVQDVTAFQQHWRQHPLVAPGFDGSETTDPAAYFAKYRGIDLLTPNALPAQMDLREQVGQLNIPVMTIVGSLETHSRKTHACEIEQLTDARRLTVNGGGHLCHLSHWKTVNAGLLGWCSDLSARITDRIE